MSTERDVDAIRARVGAATPGPWWEDHGEINAHDGVVSMPCVRRADAEFIAHAREDVPALLAALDAVTEERDRLRAALRESERALHRCRTDRPTAHSDEVWMAINDALESARAVLSSPHTEEGDEP